jgi:hypothetical protein
MRKHGMGMEEKPGQKILPVSHGLGSLGDDDVVPDRNTYIPGENKVWNGVEIDFILPGIIT